MILLCNPYARLNIFFNEMGLNMDDVVLKAYEYLIPADQCVIDTLIMILYNKERSVQEITKEVNKILEKK